MPAHRRCLQKDVHRCKERKDESDFSAKLCLLGQRRRFWRPTVKFLFKGNSVLTGVTFYVILTWAISKRLTLLGFLVPLMLLIIMEAATTIADKHITEVATGTLPMPDMVYHLTMATLMAAVEIYLWSVVIKIYQSCNCEKSMSPRPKCECPS